MEEKKSIRLGFSNCGDELRPKNNFIINILKRHFNIEITDNPDFLIVGNGGIPFQYMNYDCVRIMVMTENFSPDFTLFDYCIGFDDLVFGDRFFRLPYAFQYEDGTPWLPEILTRPQAEELLASKEFFCNFIYRHRSSNGVREEFFDRLNAYKPVISPGKYHHNIDGKNMVDLDYQANSGYLFDSKTKLDYIRKSKFTIACEPENYPGYVTEKLTDAFLGHSIPIYFGSSIADKDFNPDAFVWCRSQKEIDKIIERVIALDNDDGAYLRMLMTCPLPTQDACQSRYVELEAWLVNLFSQSPAEAIRRPKSFYVASHNERLRQYAVYWRKHDNSLHKKYRNCLRYIKKLITNMRQKIHCK